MTVSAYADFFYKYDSSKMVTDEKVQGAVCGAADHGQFSFAYTASTFSDAANNWKMKTTETRPDGNVNVAYTNHAGQVMLLDFQAGSDRWRVWTEFNSRGHFKTSIC